TKAERIVRAIRKFTRSNAQTKKARPRGRALNCSRVECATSFVLGLERALAPPEPGSVALPASCAPPRPSSAVLPEASAAAPRTPLDLSARHHRPWQNRLTAMAD